MLTLQIGNIHSRKQHINRELEVDLSEALV